LEDPNDQVVEVKIDHFSIGNEKHFVTTAKGRNYVITGAYRVLFSKNNVNVFRYSQLIHQHLKGKQCPPNLQFFTPLYCQNMCEEEERIYSLKDKFPHKEGRLMLFSRKPPGDFITNFGVENAEENLHQCLQSIVEADTFLYRHKICCRDSAYQNWLDFKSGMLTVTDVSDVIIDPPSEIPPTCTLGGRYFLIQFTLHPDIIVQTIDLYENPDLKDRVLQAVKYTIADGFGYPVKRGDSYLQLDQILSLDQIIELINRYKDMNLIPDRIGIPTELLFSHTIKIKEFIRILLTNLSDEDKAALREMHEQEIPKVEVRRGSADPRIYEALKHYHERVCGRRCSFRSERYEHWLNGCDWFENSSNDYDIPIWNTPQYEQLFAKLPPDPCYPPLREFATPRQAKPYYQHVDKSRICAPGMVQHGYHFVFK
jgi:hypothetical protein